MKCLKKFIILIATLFFITNVSGQNVKSPMIQGSDKFKSSNCTGPDDDQTCIFEYENYTVTTKSLENLVSISITDKKLKKTSNVKVSEYEKKEDYLEQYFYGIYKDFAIIDFGTSPIRTIYIYSIKSGKIINVIGGINGDKKISNGKLHCWAGMSEEKIKKLKLKEGKRETSGSGFYEEVNYHFSSNKIIPTGNRKWQN